MNDKFVVTPPAPLGSRIRELRLAKGWTLQDLAHAAGTSAPTIHRYEGGWDRFELATLRKIAAALDARVVVDLVRDDEPTPSSPPTTRALVDMLSPLFWDKDLESSHLEAYPDWVLQRVLMFGDSDQVAAVRAYFGDGAVLAAARGRAVDARTRHYWEVLLGENTHASQSPQR